MLKRSGRGHDPNGVAATQQGECAVLCPACPQPGMNLLDDWQDAPEDKQLGLPLISLCHILTCASDGFMRFS
jgi:hypothetical protein